MRQKSSPEKQPAEDAIRDIRRATRRHFSAEEKIRIVMEGLRGGRYRRALPPRGHRLIDVLWLSKEFLAAGSPAIRARAVTSDEVALDQPELCPRELAVRFTDEQEYFVSEARSIGC